MSDTAAEVGTLVQHADNAAMVDHAVFVNGYPAHVCYVLSSHLNAYAQDRQTEVCRIILF